MWKETREGGERPGFGAVEVYSHAAGDHGFVSLVNPNYWDRVYEIAPDATLGFTSAGRCEIAELYPVERLWLTAQGAWPRFGTRLPVTIPAQSVIVLEIRPPPARFDTPHLYGVPGTVEVTSTGYRVKTRGPQGRMARLAIMLPPGSRPIGSITVLDHGDEPDPRLAAPTPAKLVATTNEGALVDITFRREPSPRHLSNWKASAADLARGLTSGWNDGLPGASRIVFPLFVDASVRMPLHPADADKLGLGPAANFCGAYIENAFSQDQETWIDLAASGPAPGTAIPLTGTDRLNSQRALESIARNSAASWWFETEFNLPFLCQVGAEPGPSDHTLAVFPLLRADRAHLVRAWVNGTELILQRYRYPRNPKLGCHYADLVGSAARDGMNKLVVFVQF